MACTIAGDAKDIHAIFSRASLRAKRNVGASEQSVEQSRGISRDPSVLLRLAFELVSPVAFEANDVLDLPFTCNDTQAMAGPEAFIPQVLALLEPGIDGYENFLLFASAGDLDFAEYGKSVELLGKFGALFIGDYVSTIERVQRNWLGWGSDGL